MFYYGENERGSFLEPNFKLRSASSVSDFLSFIAISERGYFSSVHVV